MKIWKVCKILLIVLPALCLLLSLIPGIAIYEIEGKLVGFSMLLGFPSDSVLVMVSMLIPVLCIYLIITGVLYYRNEGKGMIKSTSVLSGVTLFFILTPVMVDDHLQLLPYVILPCLLALHFIAAIVMVCRRDNTFYSDPTDEILNRGK